MRSTANVRAGRAAGFSLVELAVAASLLVVLIGSLVMMGLASDRAYHTGALAAQLDAQLHRTLDRLVTELMVADLETVPPDPIEGTGLSLLEYERVTGREPGDRSRRRLAIEHEAREADDGLDNDGNGLVDECRVVLTEDPGGPNERQLVLTRWVAEFLEGEDENGIDDNGNGLIDERGFVVERVGGTLVIRLTLERAGAGGVRLSRTGQTSVRVRN